jgi:hypothetical protein
LHFTTQLYFFSLIPKLLVLEQYGNNYPTQGKP